MGHRLPERVGDIGFGIVRHPTERDTVWVLPMDGTSIWPRTSPDGKPAVYRTASGGKRWEQIAAHLPCIHSVRVAPRGGLPRRATYGPRSSTSRRSTSSAL